MAGMATASLGRSSQPLTPTTLEAPTKGGSCWPMKDRRSQRAKSASNSPRPKAPVAPVCSSQSQVSVRTPQSNWASFRGGLLSASTFFPLDCYWSKSLKSLLILFVIGQKLSTSPREASPTRADALSGVYSRGTDGVFELRILLFQSFYSIATGDNTTRGPRFLLDVARPVVESPQSRGVARSVSFARGFSDALPCDVSEGRGGISPTTGRRPLF